MKAIGVDANRMAFDRMTKDFVSSFIFLILIFDDGFPVSRLFLM